LSVKTTSSRCSKHLNAAVGLNTTGDYMNKVMAIAQHTENHVSTGNHFNPKQIDILKNSICKGVTNEEFEVFLMACVKTQLDPFMRQIYAVKRKAKRSDGTWGETMTIQTGIDGYRLIAERTGCYAPGQEPTYGHDNEGRLQCATAYVKKQTKDGTWHTVSASAYIEEYCQKTREGNPMGMWGNMPRTMLAKCAEAQALRKAFPAEMSGVYTKEEMEQAETPIAYQAPVHKISPEQAQELETILFSCEEKYRNWVFSYVKKQYNTDSIYDLPLDIYPRVKDAAVKNMEEYREKQRPASFSEQQILLQEAQ
jgi:phage recombination protein Bet